MTNKSKKDFPDFSKMTPEEEVAFWDAIDITDYVSKEDVGKHTLTLRDSSAKDDLVAFRLESRDSEMLKNKAASIGVGHSTLVRMLVKKFLSDPQKYLPI